MFPNIKYPLIMTKRSPCLLFGEGGVSIREQRLYTLFHSGASMNGCKNDRADKTRKGQQRPGCHKGTNMPNPPDSL